MKKRVLAILMVVIIVLSMTTFAVENRSRSITPGLSFSGKTANCSLEVIGDNASDTISATITLCRGTTVLKTWTESGSGYILFTDTYTVSTTGAYRLNADVTINGTTYATIGHSATCK